MILLAATVGAAGLAAGWAAGSLDEVREMFDDAWKRIISWAILMVVIILGMAIILGRSGFFSGTGPIGKAIDVLGKFAVDLVRPIVDIIKDLLKLVGLVL
jgi:hypothetical protein